MSPGRTASKDGSMECPPVEQHQKTEVRKVPKRIATKDESITLNNVHKILRRSTYTIGYYEIYLKSPELNKG
jgi:hypothetical protein